VIVSKMGDYVFVPLRIWHDAPVDTVVRFDTTRQAVSLATQPFRSKFRMSIPKFFATYKWYSNHGDF
jgi:hypothetical protein